MTMLEVVEAKPELGEKLNHWACCEAVEAVAPNGEKALCGTDLTGIPNKDFGESASCTVCEFIDKNDPEFCPRYGRCRG